MTCIVYVNDTKKKTWTLSGCDSYPNIIIWTIKILKRYYSHYFHSLLTIYVDKNSHKPDYNRTDSYTLGCTIFSKCSQIKPTFLHSMCIGEIRSHAKFQVSSFKDLAWPPLFVNQSWHWESHLKWPESGTFDLAPFIGIKNALQNGIILGVLNFRKYVKRMDGNW